MPSMDVTSVPDQNEIRNGVDIALKELTNRYDFRDSKTTIEPQSGKDGIVALDIESADDYKTRAATDVLMEKFAKRKIPLGFFDAQDVETTPSGRGKRTILVKSGIGRDLASKINKSIKAEKIKVQVEIRGDEVRISGKKRDDLQSVIAFLKEKITDQPLNFGNFRD